MNEHERPILKLSTIETSSRSMRSAESTRLSITQLTAALLTVETRELNRALPGKCFVRKL